MEGHGHLYLVYRVLLHSAIAFSAKLSFLYGYSLLKFNVYLGNIIMILAITVLSVAGYYLSKGHPRFMYVRMFLLALLFTIFIGMLLEGNGILI